MANQNELLGAAFCKGKLSSGSKPQPQRASPQESNAIRFRPRPSSLHRANLNWAERGSLGPVALLEVSGSRNPLPTASPSLGSRIGRAKASAPRPQPCPPSQFGCSVPRPRGNGKPKRASGSCILQRETLFRQETTAPNGLGSGKRRKPFSPPAIRSPSGKAGLGCTWIPGTYRFPGGLRSPKPTPHGFSFVGKQDWVPERLVRPGPRHAP